MLWEPEQCCQEVNGLAVPVPSPNSVPESPPLVCFTTSELPLPKGGHCAVADCETPEFPEDTVTTVAVAG